MIFSEDKYLFFKISDEEYGISVHNIKEIIQIVPINAVPQTPEFMRGVISLRDKVIPIVDLKLKLGLHCEDCNYTERACIIVSEIISPEMEGCWIAKNCRSEKCPAYKNDNRRCWLISGTFCRNEIQGTYYHKINACRKCDFFKSANHQKYLVGILADDVFKVSGVQSETFKESPKIVGISSNIVKGMITSEKGMKILLNLDSLLTYNDRRISQ